VPKQTQELDAFVQRDGEEYLPSQIACCGWGQTLGGQVVGGLLARAIEELADETLQPARLTVDLLRRVALRPLRFKAEIVRSGSRMQSVDAQVIQDDQVVARASAPRRCSIAWARSGAARPPRSPIRASRYRPMTRKSAEPPLVLGAQESAIPDCSLASTCSRLNDADFCRWGNSMSVCSMFAT
jgi:Thioesterase-like superfamily